MSLMLRLDKLRPEVLSAAFAVAEEAPSMSEMETAKDRVRQIKSRRHKLMPAQLHRANTLLTAKGKPAYDQYITEETERFEDKRSAELSEALEQLEALEQRQMRSTPEGILMHALEMGLRLLATNSPAVAKALEQKPTR